MSPCDVPQKVSVVTFGVSVGEDFRFQMWVIVQPDSLPRPTQLVCSPAAQDLFASAERDTL